MRSYKEILSFLLIREQLSLGWMIGFFVVCSALLYGSLTLSNVRVQSVEVLGTVINGRAEMKESASGDYLMVKLDNGETVRASATEKTEHRHGQRVIVKETTTNFFGFRKHEFKKYLEEPHHE